MAHVNDSSINNIDFAMIKMKLMDPVEGEGWSSELTDEVVVEYRKFLYLTKTLESSEVVPSTLVDKVWHYHILDTRAYEQDCKEVFGKFMHHFPYWGMRGEDDAKSLQSAWERTLDEYRTVFQCEPPRELWTAAGRCPNCGSGSTCFLGETPVHMLDGTTKPISGLVIGDALSQGTVTAVMQFVYTDADALFLYDGVYVTGSHAVLEGGAWKRVADAEFASRTKPEMRPRAVYCINTTTHQLLAGPNKTVFADYIETEGRAISAIQKLSLMEINSASSRATSAAPPAAPAMVTCCN